MSRENQRSGQVTVDSPLVGGGAGRYSGESSNLNSPTAREWSPEMQAASAAPRDVLNAGCVSAIADQLDAGTAATDLVILTGVLSATIEGEATRQTGGDLTARGGGGVGAGAAGFLAERMTVSSDQPMPYAVRRTRVREVPAISSALDRAFVSVHLGSPMRLTVDGIPREVTTGEPVDVALPVGLHTFEVSLGGNEYETEEDLSVGVPYQLEVIPWGQTQRGTFKKFGFVWVATGAALAGFAVAADRQAVNAPTQESSYDWVAVQNAAVGLALGFGGMSLISFTLTPLADDTRLTISAGD